MDVRRLLLLAAFLAPQAAYAQVRTAPVQLSLSFAPAPAAFLAAPPSLSAFQPLSLAPSLSPSPIVAAFHTGDPAVFLKTARAAEYEPPEGDEHQNALYRLGLEREAVERALAKAGQADAPPVKARKTAIDYDEFGRNLASAPGLSLDPFKHADAKRRILKASGYSRIYGAGGVPVPIDRAADVRVGKTFANVLRAFERR